MSLIVPEDALKTPAARAAYSIYETSINSLRACAKHMRAAGFDAHAQSFEQDASSMTVRAQLHLRAITGHQISSEPPTVER